MQRVRVLETMHECVKCRALSKLASVFMYWKEWMNICMLRWDVYIRTWICR
jgi:hypothetical protein